MYIYRLYLNNAEHPDHYILSYLFFHVGYDKLKPFGFPVHGAIDGFSRKVLWVDVTWSNNSPQSVRENKGCPLQTCTDCGTENGIIAGAQCYFHIFLVLLHITRGLKTGGFSFLKTWLMKNN